MTTRKGLRILPWAALLVVAAAALAVGSQRGGRPPSIAERVNAIAVGIRCPVCGGQNVADSDTYVAQAIKTDIARRLRSGETVAQIRAYLVSRYGTRILESPPATGVNGLVWWVPATVTLAAGIGLFVALRRSRSAPARPPSAEDRALVDAALRRPKV
ncbi:MAG: cytochrome c-type biogenesis protein [Acidimicrobiales bacterium]